MFSPAFLDEVRDRTPLSTLIGRSIALKKAGREQKGCCPFHSEKSPSFYVNDDKGFYHCFGCGAHGDAIRWMTDHGGVTFVDAVKELAAAAGLEIPASDPRQAERDRDRDVMLGVMERAQRWFMAMLAEPAAAPIRQGYLAEQRGLTGEVNEIFGIGYAPGGRNAPKLLEHLKDVPPKLLQTLGLTKERDDGSIYDAFRGRVMFPIHDTRGRVIGFGGRAMGDAQPKYLNSSDTPLFDKGRVLFNAHRAAQPARKAGRLVLVEGYMDVVALTRAGVPEAVAPNGTALTEAQITHAWRMAETPICFFDGDTAGLRAAARAAIRALPILEPAKSLSFVFPPAGKDPDDILREGGAQAVQAMLVAPRPLVDVLWQHELDAAPHDTPEAVAGLRARLRQHIGTIRSHDVRQAYADEMRKRFDARFAGRAEASPRSSQIRSTHPAAERQPFRRPPAPASRAQRQIGRQGIGSSIEHAIYLGLLRYPEVARQQMESVLLAHFRDERIADAVKVMMAILIAPDPITAEALAERMGDHALIAGPSGRLPFSFASPSSDRAQAMHDLVDAIETLAQR